jgi:hypothetical protein
VNTAQTSEDPVGGRSSTEFERAIAYLKEAQSLLDKIGASPEIGARLEEVIIAIEEQCR